jgi:hypothetical protein
MKILKYALYFCISSLINKACSSFTTNSIDHLYGTILKSNPSFITFDKNHHNTPPSLVSLQGNQGSIFSVCSLLLTELDEI